MGTTVYADILQFQKDFQDVLGNLDIIDEEIVMQTL